MTSLQYSAFSGPLKPPSQHSQAALTSAILEKIRPNVPRSASLILGFLKQLKVGHLWLVLPPSEVQAQPLCFGESLGDSDTKHPVATLKLHNWKLFEATLKSGDVGFAQTWIAGDWETDNLIDLLDLVVANREVIEQAVYGHWLGRLVFRIKHLLNRNTRSGSKRNIHAHYDLGNDFYKLWLDPGMTYSSALFTGDNRLEKNLAEGQDAKYQRMIDELGLSAGARVLEIGCGWGGFVEKAVKHGLSLKALTLSGEQLHFAQSRVNALGQAGQVKLALQDYRDEKQQYDGIVSIEMFEAVGEAYWPGYFDTLSTCLKSGAKAVVQTITIRDDLFERYRLGTDFIQQYIFPGGMLPSPQVFRNLAQRHGLQVVKEFSFGLDYAQTLSQWREKFMAQLDQVRSHGFDMAFIRTWEFYLAYCEAAFRRGNTDVMQYTLQKS